MAATTKEGVHGQGKDLQGTGDGVQGRRNGGFIKVGGSLRFREEDVAEFESRSSQERVHVRESLVEVNGTPLPRINQDGAKRSVSLPRFLSHMLGERLGEFPPVNDLVFTSAKGKPLSIRSAAKDPLQ